MCKVVFSAPESSRYAWHSSGSRVGPNQNEMFSLTHLVSSHAACLICPGFDLLLRFLPPAKWRKSESVMSLPRLTNRTREDAQTFREQL